jgi:hypothetical protein
LRGQFIAEACSEDCSTSTTEPPELAPPVRANRQVSALGRVLKPFTVVVSDEETAPEEASGGDREDERE